MATCLQHPGEEAAGTCELCLEPRCGRCLEKLLGRRYCPSCLARVRGLAGIGAAAPAGPAAAQAGGAAGGLGASAPPRLPGWLSALLYLIGFFILFTGAQTMLALALVGARLAAGQPLPRAGGDLMDASAIGLPLWTLLFGGFGWGTLAVILVYTHLLGRGLEKRSLAGLGLAWSGTAVRDAAAGLALAAIFFISVVGLGLARDWYEIRGTSSAMEGAVIAAGGFLVLLPYAAVEEITTRGFIFNAAARSWGRAGGVLASTAVFTLLHASNPGVKPLAMVGLALAGLYLASAYLITDRLWLPIFLHTGWNLAEGPIFGLPVSGMEVPASLLRLRTTGPAEWTGGSFGPEGGLLLIMMMVVHIAALWAMRPLFRPRGPVPGGGPGSPAVSLS